MISKSALIGLSLALSGALASQALAASEHRTRSSQPIVVAKKGADNAAADKAEKRGRGAGGAQDTRATDPSTMTVARQGCGADDGAAHEAGEHAGGDDKGGARTGDDRGGAVGGGARAGDDRGGSVGGGRGGDDRGGDNHGGRGGRG